MCLAPKLFDNNIDNTASGNICNMIICPINMCAHAHK